jgi:beta-galactosidase
MGTITFDPHSFVIDGQRRFLLIGTINYFRLQPDDWEQRLRLFKQSGFNTVDIYVAWAYHEASEGEFDFESPARDLDRYLTLCKTLGLYVYFRPGPYICNEFDFGGLPPWLLTKPDVHIRQNEPNFLAYARRYLSRVNAIVERHQYTRGGSIILYAIENELDFYATKDVPGYMTALRDYVRADGIDVPIAACVGQRTQVDRAMGLIDDVIPTPNIYVNGPGVEAEAAKALQALRDARSITGRPYAVPPFVTEMGRGENDLRRIMSQGFTGLGPFNFAGGSNWDRYHAVNNWGDYKQLTTSIDFGGMIGFDGTIGQTFFDARRLAKFIAAVEPEITTTNVVDDVKPLGSAQISTHTLASGPTRFTFLANLTDEPADVAIDVQGLRVPRHGTLSVPGKKTPIITSRLSLARVGLHASIAYCTAEFWELSGKDGVVHVDLLLPADASGDIAFDEGEGPGDPIALRVGLVRQIHVAGGVVHVRVLDEAVTERAGLTDVRVLGQPIELASRAWEIREPAPQPVLVEWTGDLRSLESLGVVHGAGVYETMIYSTGPVTDISIDYAADLVSRWVDDAFECTVLADGKPYQASLSLPAGPHRLKLRVEAWGRPCFHDERWPAAKLGAQRGLIGRFGVNGSPADCAWRFSPDPIRPPERHGVSSTTPLASFDIPPGEARVAQLRLEEAFPLGAVLELAGSNVTVLIYVDGVGVGRLGFDGLFRFTGGPNSRVLASGALMKRNAVVTLLIRSTQSTRGRVERVTLEPLASADRA